MENMELWNMVSKTDPSATKNFQGKGGFRGTAVCAQSQRKEATRLFGPAGISWGVRNEQFEIIQLGEDSHSKRLFYSAELYYSFKDEPGSLPVSAEIDVWTYSKNYKKWTVGNDLRKKVKTDALTKGLSELGFNSDIFEGKFDDNKYVQELWEEKKKNSQQWAMSDQSREEVKELCKELNVSVKKFLEDHKITIATTDDQVEAIIVAIREAMA